MSSRRRPPEGLQVRAATSADVPTIARFQQAMARETEDHELDTERLHAGVTAVVADPSRGSYRVCEAGGEVLGCLLVTREWSDWRNGWFWWIQSVYTSPDARGRGVYRTLYDAVLEAAQEDGSVCGVRLYVDRENHAAQAVYRRLGMRPARYEFFEVEV